MSGGFIRTAILNVSIFYFIDLAPFIQYIRLALAMAIIKTKPPEFDSAETYADYLMTQHQLDMEKTQEKGNKMKMQILQLTQKILSSQSELSSSGKLTEFTWIICISWPCSIVSS
jgi:hypothetical protein